ncbi:MAG: PAS domain S-box protein [Candidatus Ratteibacteria bacterium]|nr:PAS domain S-box protein [Candidatus Ratteibacteria bacterium]
MGKGESKNLSGGQQEVEKLLKENGERFKDISETAFGWIWEVDPKGKYTYSGPAVEKILGYKPEEVLKKHFYDLCHPEDREEVKKKAFEMFAQRGPFRKFINRNICKNGRIVWLSTSGVPIIDEKGKFLGYRGVDIEITDCKKTEAALEESEKRLSQIIQGNSIPTAVIDRNHLITHWNTACENLTGIPARKMIGTKKQWSAFYPEQRPIMADLIVDKVSEKKMRRYYDDRYRKSTVIKGAYEAEDFFPYVGDRWLFSTAAPLRDIEGKLTGAIETWQDITERKKAEARIQQSFDTLQRVFEETVQAMTEIIETRDPYTAGHQRRVANLACAIAREMGLSEDQISGIRLAGILHDIGKIYVPSEILSKPDRLSKIEFEIIRTHSQRGYDILKTIEFHWPIAKMVLQHHERMNGSGYPLGLSDEGILLEARILGVADVVEAMAFHRPYRNALGIDGALAEISKNRGILYDTRVVDACLKLFAKKRFEFE